VLVDRTLATKLWPGRSAVGERMLVRVNTLEPQFVQVIGVVEHERAQTTTREGTETVYVTNTYVGTNGDLYWIVRTSLDPEGLVPQVRAALAELDPALPIADARPMDARVAAAGSAVAFSLVLIGLFGSLALFLAAVGLYGVLSFTVRQRTGEFGVRLALGATTEHVLGLVLRQGLTLTAIGLGVGVIGGIWTTRLLSTLLVDVSPADPATFGVMAAVLAAAALWASYLPARRATRVDPAEALRADE
jgi:putative ABC transport system permease protein